jgi:hypothetical protein
MPRKTPHTATSDYEAKTSHEAVQLAGETARIGPKPFGDPLSGVVLVAEAAAGATGEKMADAIRRSLVAVELERVYVTWSHPKLLTEMLFLEPTALVAVGSAARAIDSLNYPLAKAQFSEATEGCWFAWTEGTSGLRLPALVPALTDAGAKRRFWRAFLAIRALASDS